ncbi:chain-length determining protein [Sphingorhabdus soli]|uniref:Chain-length determining protein n=1 Tax=Flavisphingopyxis soli TaxID=2601267 RepID=A0A5C6UB31_9SPHN|nr:XrtA system polysaccharide chain length determinant [Sphingorhabdus soli]TXC68908.1 chain-length determining protein [Sphingorhabdus soli]
MDSLYDEIRVALHAIWLRRWLALAVAWIICILGWLVVALIPNTYQSTAKVLVNVNQVVSDQVSGTQVDTRRQIDEVRQTLTSVAALEKVVVATGIVAPGASDKARLSAASALQKKIVVLATQDNVFQVTDSVSLSDKSDSENARLAPQVLTELIAVARDQRSAGGRLNARQSIDFLNAQLESRGKDLQQAEQRRVAFETNNVGLMPGIGSASQRMESARAEINQIESQLVSARSSLAALNGQLASTPATVAGGIGAVGGSVARQQLAAAQSDLASMKARGLTDSHPDVIATRAQVEALRAQAAREGPAGASGQITNPAYGSLQAMRAERQATVTALESRKAQLQGDVTSMLSQRIQEPEVAAEYDRINRDYTVMKDQYDQLAAQLEQARLRGDLEVETDAVSIAVIDPPSQPRAPVSPNRPLLLAGILIVGLVGGAGAAFAQGQIQTSYPTASRLERASGLPVIGSITESLTAPLVEERKRKMKWLAGGSAGLIGLFAILMIVEFVQRGMVA